MCRTGAWIGWRRLRRNLAPLPKRGERRGMMGKDRQSVGRSRSSRTDREGRAREGSARTPREKRAGFDARDGVWPVRATARPSACLPTDGEARSPPRCLLSGAAASGAADLGRAGRALERPVRVARREGYRDGRGWCAGSGLTSIETAWVAVSRGCEWRWGPSDRVASPLELSRSRAPPPRREEETESHTRAKFHLAFGHLAFGLESFSSSIFFPQESHFPTPS